MIRSFIIVIILFVSTCTAPNNISDYKGCVIRYKYVDLKGDWLELGLTKGKKNYLIYLPKDYEIVYYVGDTIK